MLREEFVFRCDSNWNLELCGVMMVGITSSSFSDMLTFRVYLGGSTGGSWGGLLLTSSFFLRSVLSALAAVLWGFSVFGAGGRDFSSEIGQLSVHPVIIDIK